MNTTLLRLALAAFTLSTGCGPLLQGADLAHKDLIHQQIAESVPVKEWGYIIQDVRLSDDTHKLLIVLLAPAGAAPRDLILDDDGFRRYAGAMIDLARQEAAKSGNTPSWSTSVTVTLPDTLPAYPHQREFREQLEASLPVQKWGCKIQDIRFTADYKKALVIFKQANEAVGVILEDDGFRRFQGKFPRLWDKPPRSGAEFLALDAECRITVTLPDK
jgi:hypothetical protein